MSGWVPWQIVTVMDHFQAERVVKVHGKKLVAAEVDGDEERVAQGKFFNNAKLYDLLRPCFRDYRRHEGLNIQWNDFERLHIVRYEAGGKYEWHADNELTPYSDRKLSMVLALNDGYEGGGTEFMWPHPGSVHHVDLKVGEAVIFPSILFHRGVEVTSGERWILVSWVVGKEWR